MNNLKFFYKKNFNSIILSKNIVTGLKKIPRFNKLVLFFIINLKQYKKNLYLFYILLSLLVGGGHYLKKKIINFLMLVEVSIKKEFYIYLQKFVTFYLPILSSTENKIKESFFKSESIKKQYYRVNYFSFPVIPELDLIYEQQEMLYNFVSNYRLQLELVIECKDIKQAGLFLARLYRLPYNLYAN